MVAWIVAWMLHDLHGMRNSLFCTSLHDVAWFLRKIPGLKKEAATTPLHLITHWLVS